MLPNPNLQLAALTNSALVYLFRPADTCKAVVGTTLQHAHRHLATDDDSSARALLTSAAVVALGASHGYLVLRLAVRHVLERLLWKGSAAAREVERLETEVKQQYLRSTGVADVAAGEDVVDSTTVQQDGDRVDGGSHAAFWAADEGLDELSKGVKDA
jgi:anoctamin-10